MDTENLKKALLQGIPAGLVLALVILGIRTLIGGSPFLDNLKSLYGILSLICFPVALVCYFYYRGQNKKDKQGCCMNNRIAALR